MQVIADLQLHSKYSRAVSPQMTIPFIAQWAKKKGIRLVATGDWTHPLWIREIQINLEEMGNGLLRMRDRDRDRDRDREKQDNSPLFLLATEVSSIFSQGGKLRRVHTLIWVPTISSAEKINEEMRRRGCNLMVDGRPIVGLSCIQIAELVLSIEPKALLIPAHAWTPHFSVFGSASGFDSIEEAFGQFSKNIYAIETGLSSSPSMNWRIKELDHRSIVSFSDAHSGPKLGREATVFETRNNEQETENNEISYDDIYAAIAGASPKVHAGKLKIGFTIEFYPEEGKYHYTGHRNCNVKLSPEETIKKGTLCPICGKSLTQGVMQRVEQLAGRSEESLKLKVKKAQEVQLVQSGLFPNRPPFVMLIPLQEIIAETIGSPTASPRTQVLYDQLTAEFGGEFSVLLATTTSDIARLVGEKMATAVRKVRRGDIEIDPGYDGVFGKVKIWKEEREAITSEPPKEQLTLL